MNRLASLALVVLGAALLAWSWDAYHSVGSGVSRLLTGVSTERAQRLLIGGVLALAAGVGGLARGRGPRA